MTLEVNRLLSKRLFTENIYPHVIEDLKILDTIQSDTHSNTCAVPTAMLILSSLDFLGFLLRSSGNINETEVNITTALQYNKYFPPTYTSEVIKDLCISFRHGLMHTCYPKQTSSRIYGIHKSQNLELLEQKSISGYNLVSLNVNILSTDFKNFIDKLYEEINSTQDINFLENINNCFKLIYPEELTTSSTTTTETTIPYGVSGNK